MAGSVTARTMTDRGRVLFRALSLAGLLLAASWPAEAQVASGSYVGNGIAGRAITGAGFRPDVVIVKVNFDGGTDATPPCSSLDDCSSAVIRTSTMAGTSSKPVKGNQAYAANMITALNGDGFTVGNDLKVNALNSCPASTTPCLYYWVAIKADASVKVGQYTGNNGTQSIVGLGFSPEWVATIPTDTAVPMMRFSVDANSYHWWSGAPLAPTITSLDATGFTVQNGCGAPCNQNASTVTYHYVAMNDTAGRIKVGQYTGNNTSPHSIPGVGFQPEYVMTRGLSADGYEQVEKTTTMPALQSVTFRGALSNNRIRDFEADGFAVGSATIVNDNLKNYAYLAIAGMGCCNLATADPGDGTLTVTAPGSFEMRYNAATGGGIDQLYDLAESPLRDTSHDLAGGVNDLRALHDFEIAPNGGPFAGVNHTTEDNSSGSRVDLLEATPTRVRVRQDALFQADGGTNILGGLEGVGDYSVYGTGRTAVGWTEKDWNTPLFVYARRQIGMTAHYTSGAPLNIYTPCYEGNGACNSSGGGGAAADWLLGVRNSAGARTDFLTILSQDWAQANTVEYLADQTAGLEFSDQVWQHFGAGSAASQTWNLLTYFKPTNLSAQVGPQDPAVISRSTDYRTPDSPGIMTGLSWQDPDENTASDNFNEAEAAYLFTLDTTNGLRFTMNGSVHPPLHALLQGPPVEGIQPAGHDHVRPRFGRSGASRHAGAQRRLHRRRQAHFARLLRPGPAVALHAAGRGGGDLAGRGSGRVRGRTGCRQLRHCPLRQGCQLHRQHPVRRLLHERLQQGQGRRGVLVSTHLRQLGRRPPRHLRVLRLGGSHVFVLEKPVGNTLDFVILESGPPLTGQGRGHGLRLAGQRLGPHTTGMGRHAALGDPAATLLEWSRAGPHRSRRRLRQRHLDGPTRVPVREHRRRRHLRAGGVRRDPHLRRQRGGAPPLAHGGLLSDAREYLRSATPARNFQYAFAPVDTTRRGRYAYFGSDSKWSGLNVYLAVRGASAGALDLQWQFWNGTTWANLESGYGFTDPTANLTANGSIYWTGDPASWKPYSVDGGPDLYYVRAYLTNTSAAYTTPPTESEITADILLFQYCSDVTAANQEFRFLAPVATAVGLLSFSATGGDGAVDLLWRTGSEVDNLGFHVYRSLAEGGPWIRVTSSLIPGQGFSATGAAYAWRDSGLQNGTRYFYRLEDVDTKAVSTFHDPVSAVPQANATPPAPPPPAGGGGSGSGGSGSGGSGSGSGGGSSSSSCPAWARAQLGSSASYTCEAHGDPAATSFRVLSRSSRSALVELQTEGFLTARDATGRVRALLPGFDSLSDPLAPALPLKRARLDGVVGRQARIGSIQARDNRFFSGLVAAAVGYPQAVVAPDGTVNPGRREAELLLSRGAFPRVQARLAGEGFQGEDKTLALELMPLRYDASRGALVLSRRLIVRVDFAGAEPSEIGRGRLGRHIPRSRPDSNAYAFLGTSQKGLHSVAFEALFPGRSRPLDLASLRLTTNVIPRDPNPTGPEGSAGMRGDIALLRPAAGPHLRARQPALLPRGQDRCLHVLLGGDGLCPRAGLRWSTDGARKRHRGRIGGRFLARRRLLRDQPPLRPRRPRHRGPVAVGVARLRREQDQALRPRRPRPLLARDRAARRLPPGRLRRRLRRGPPRPGLRERGPRGRGELRRRRASPDGSRRPRLAPRGRERSDRHERGRHGCLLPRLPRPLRGPLPPGDRRPLRGLRRGLLRLPGRPRSPGSPRPSLSSTSPHGASWLTGYEAGPSLRFRAETGHRYLAVSQEALLSPRVFFPEPSARLRSTQNQADYVLVAPRAFLDAAQPLLERRQAQGLSTFAASLEEIASSFGGGQVSAEAIRDFLSFAYHQWRRPSPRYVLLLGDANYDPRRFNPASQPSPMPFLLQRTSYIWTASDPALVALNGDDILPDLAIGRLPATTVEQAQTMVAKILDWEAQGQNLDGTAALVADNPDLAGDFEADARDIESSFLAGRDTTQVFLGQLPNRDVARARILDAFNQGLSLISYVGHGGGAVWAGENILNSSDPAALLAQPRQPFMLTMNCLNGYFIAPFYESLAEGFLKAPGKGTIAAFSPSGLSLDGPAHLYHRAVMQEITGGQHQRLGDAILAAQKTYAQTGAFPELLSLYHLFGDPAMRIEP